VMEMAKRWCSNLEKKKEKNKTLWRSRQRYKKDFCFAGQDTIESVTGFRIDGRTIMRGTLLLDNSVI
jgi:hypothetical protein